MVEDAAALLYCVLGGVFMGSFTVPMKAPSVLRARADPLVFQCYKSFWAFAAGLLFLLHNAVSKSGLVFEFTWWAVLSAAAWIPAGVCVIVAVPRLGVGLAMVLEAGTSSVVSFLVFWLAFGEEMRAHGSPSHQYYIAPFYLLLTLVGMSGVVAAAHARAPKWRRNGDLQEPLSDAGTLLQSPEPRRSPQGLSLASGACYAILSGGLISLQYGVVTAARQWAERAEGCGGSLGACSPELRERFNNLGSWTTSFGIGAAAVTASWLAAATAQRGTRPSFHFQALWAPGSISGLCWVCGFVFQTLAVLRGGQAVIMPLLMGIRMVTSSMWGLLYYGEMREPQRVALWLAAACLTLRATLLLSREHASCPADAACR